MHQRNKFLFFWLLTSGLCLLMSACASNYIRIHRLDATGRTVAVDAMAGGCGVDIQGRLDGLAVQYNNGPCTITYTAPAAIDKNAQEAPE